MAEGKTERILTLYRRLCDGEIVNKTEMAEMLQVDSRTIQRDIDDLRAYFANGSAASDICPAIIYDRKAKGFCLDFGVEKMSGSQLLAVCKVLLESRAFTKRELDVLLSKLLKNCAPIGERKKVEELIANEIHHYIEPRHHKAVIERLWELGNAVKSQQYVLIGYNKLGAESPVQRLVKPVGIMFSEFYFYLIAFIEAEDTGENQYLSPAIYRVDRIQTCEIQDRHFAVPYKERFEEGEFRKRVQFMYGGKLQKLVFEYSGLSVEAILDRLPTAEIIKEQNGVYTIKTEVFGNGIDMWLRSQGDSIKIISRKILN